GSGQDEAHRVLWIPSLENVALVAVDHVVGWSGDGAEVREAGREGSGAEASERQEYGHVVHFCRDDLLSHAPRRVGRSDSHRSAKRPTTSCRELTTMTDTDTHEAFTACQERAQRRAARSAP